MLNILKTNFGYDSFRPLQKEIIDYVVAGNDSLVLMPTGGGKSLCYQLPALLFPGLTIVVSPLISLMKDQVDALQANGISAEFLNSTLSPEVIEVIQGRAVRGEIKLLYIAPERLANSLFRHFLSSLNVSLIAVDEAHCISEWGHDFRPDYRNFSTLRNLFKGVPVIALTATATKRVRLDILNQLGLKEDETFISSFNRPNLQYAVEPKYKTFDQLIILLNKYKGEPTIIYCFSRKQTEQLAGDLRGAGFNAKPYHAGLSKDARQETQEQFITDEVPIIIATIAFGMGIDKPDVRLVVHYDLPKTLEGYYQETGRAGRDGLPAECVLFFTLADKRKQDYFINMMANAEEQENARQKLGQVIEYCSLGVCRRKFLLGYFDETVNENNCGNCDNCLAPAHDHNITALAHNIIRAVIETGERFGAGHVIKVLRGSKTKRLEDFGHNALSTFGLEKKTSEAELKHAVDQLIKKGVVKKNTGDYPTLSIDSEGRNLLQSGAQIYIQMPKAEMLKLTTPQVEDLKYNTELFESLRNIRKQIADQKSVPPFVIFGNKSLMEMAYYLPKNREEFAKISGVGHQKLEQFADIFIEIIQTFAKQNNLESKTIPANGKAEQKRLVGREGSTYAETKRLIDQKFTLQAIASERNIKEGTVISHIEQLVISDGNLDITHLRPAESRLKPILAAFYKSGQTSLSPVKTLLGEKFSFDEIRLARLFLE